MDSIQPEPVFLDEAQRIKKTILKEGIGEQARVGQQVYFFYIMRYIDGQFIAGSETSSFSGFLGKQELIPALDLVIQTMKLGERCLLDIPADLAFTDQQQLDQLEAGKSLQFEVEIVRFGRTKREKYELNEQERLQEAQTLKNEGNEEIKQQRFEIAQKKYSFALDLINDDTGKLFDDVRSQLLNNLTLAHIKVKNFDQCVAIANQALALAPENVKILFRRSQAFQELRNFEAAKKDLQEALRIEPKNADVIKELDSLPAKKLKLEKQEKEVYSKMFK